MSPDGVANAAEPPTAFAAPWEARAFAIAVLASRQGCFTWPEWTRALSRELRRASAGEAGAARAGYFECWLAALESLLLGSGAIEQNELRVRKDAWEDAHRRTPHGAPVSLRPR